MTADKEPKLPTPPFIILPGIDNLRDIGGYPIAPKGSVRRGFLYRSAHLASLTDETATALAKDLGIKTIYDFRSNTENERVPSCDVPGVTRVHIPVFPEKDASPEAIALRFQNYSSSESSAGYVRAYSEILSEGAKKAYRLVFEHIRDRPDEPLLFHCMGGKDRTGCFSALCLRLAGVIDDEMIVKEYALTKDGLFRLNQMFMVMLQQSPAFAENPEGTAKMLSSEPEYMRDTLKYLDETYGSVEGYMRDAVKFSDEDIEKIKRNLRSEEEPLKFEFL
ncbi:Protein-tyrosine/Dual-specificity phosphatase [Ascosphaera apis ARSEF 7405]|uniref:Protein-tyrosine/Dual-specificity phosphatase n=1 Tax=Ascosphaera apis ARSEF 7405 TaxID=392613 RepID=A0A167WT93_9EURO|nr:Protein-tyrosine/Dual-specificity phosphatase [Ascosphaera apis ARSEF 7405]